MGETETRWVLMGLILIITGADKTGKVEELEGENWNCLKQVGLDMERKLNSDFERKSKVGTCSTEREIAGRDQEWRLGMEKEWKWGRDKGSGMEKI